MTIVPLTTIIIGNNSIYFVRIIRTALTLISLIIFLPAFSQNHVREEPKEKACMTVGVFQGGGALVGADLELPVTKRFSFQVGAGFKGYGGGINFHLKPSLKSSFISLQYYHQGFGESYSQSFIGPTFVYRSRGWITFSIGGGATLEKGPAWPDDIDHPEYLLIYSIGAYKVF